MAPLPVTFDDIKQAQAAIAGALPVTPFLRSRTLSDLTGADLWLKFENLQFTASFKERGALNKLLSLTEAEKKRGVIAMSAGNHAQGVAYHAHRLGIPATIVMPEFTPFTKVAQTQGHGANVVLAGKTLSQASDKAHQLAREHEFAFVHPYDDAGIIAGQGTLALEMLAVNPNLDAVVVPIGGGGLISGISIAVKHLSPETKVIGVEAELFPAMKVMREGQRPSFGTTTIAEGIAVSRIGELTARIADRLVDDIQLVTEAQIERAVYLLLVIEKTVVEGAAATTLAAVLADPGFYRGKCVGLVISGGNIDARLLSSVIMRELMRDDRICRIEVDIADAPGHLSAIAHLIGDKGGNIIDVEHERLALAISAKHTRLNILFEARDASHAADIVAAISACGIAVRTVGS